MLKKMHFPLGMASLITSSINKKYHAIREAILREKCSFLTLFKKPLNPPPPLLFEHYVVNFSEGILTKVRKRLLQQLSTISYPCLIRRLPIPLPGWLWRS